MMRSVPAAETEIDLTDDGGDSEDEQPWKTQLETVLEEEEEEASTQSDTRPLINERDPRQINECLKVSFEDVIAEPPSVRSGDWVWIWSATSFEVARVWFYRVVALLLAVPFAVISGVTFGLLGCLHVWSFTPFVKVVFINVGWLKTLWSGVVDIFVLPVFHSAAKCCSGVSVQMLPE